MKIVIQCAGSKDENPAAGYFRADGMPIMFVAHPERAGFQKKYRFERPDACAFPGGKTWRDLVLEYNLEHRASLNNPFGLLPAYRLYSNSIYGKLVEKFGVARVYILSAGWGLIGADFLTPKYDITFRSSAEPSKAFQRRKRGDEYADFCELMDADPEPVVFLGGKDYLPLFCQLTSRLRSKRTIVFNSKFPPNAAGCACKKYPATRNTNWHYDCA